LFEPENIIQHHMKYFMFICRVYKYFEVHGLTDLVANEKIL